MECIVSANEEDKNSRIIDYIIPYYGIMRQSGIEGLGIRVMR